MQALPKKNVIMSNKDETQRIFANAYLERLTHATPLTPLCLFTPIVIGFSYFSIQHHPISLFLINFILGLFLWTFIEYGLHRFIFHFNYNAQNLIAKKFFFLMHGIHHAYPRDSTRLVLPPVFSLVAASLVYSLFYLVFGKYCDAIYPGTILGYIIYDLTHYAVHHYNSKNKLFQYLKRYHLSHHFVDNDKGFGVSTPLWDYIFRTKAVFLNSKNK